MQNTNTSSSRTSRSSRMSLERTRSTRYDDHILCQWFLIATRIAANFGRETRQMQDAVRLPCHQSSVDHPQHVRPSRDNLEFLQWIKRFWDTNYGGQGYDAVARRRGAPTDTPATIAPLAPSSSRGSAGSLHAGAGRVAGGRTPVGPRAGSRAGSTQPNELVQNLQGQLREMSTHLEGLEKERDFYFAKVRTCCLRFCRSRRRLLGTLLYIGPQNDVTYHSCATSRSWYSSSLRRLSKKARMTLFSAIFRRSYIRRRSA